MDMTTQNLNIKETMVKGVTVLSVSEMPQGNINAEKGQSYLLQGDSYDWLKKIPENSMDSVVCDPPYLLNFMGKDFDREKGNPADDIEFWKLVLKTMKPGAHLLAAGIGRTHHRVMVTIEDAGFEIRDCVYHVFGSGFPKSHNIGKAVDKLHGNEREVTGKGKPMSSLGVMHDDDWKSDESYNETKGSSPYEGWGTALKPAVEIWTLARKPLSESTIAENVLKWGTGGINIDGCRVGTGEDRTQGGTGGMKTSYVGGELENKVERATGGRFPANFIHDGSDEVIGLFPDTSKSKATSRGLQHSSRHGGLADIGGNIKDGTDTIRGHNDNGGSASRFFYCAKASKRDRNEGLEGFEEKDCGRNTTRKCGNCDKPIIGLSQTEKCVCENRTEVQTKNKNNHPTVKPTALMQYLVRLVTPKGGTCLDPFMGSGSTGKACKLEGFDFIGIELDPDYCKIAEARIEHCKVENKLL